MILKASLIFDKMRVTFIHFVALWVLMGKQVWLYGDIEPNECLLNAVIFAYKNAHINDLAELVSQEMRFSLDSSLLSDYETEELSFESETEEELDETYVGF